VRDPFNAMMPYPAVAVASGSGPLSGKRLAVKDIFDVAGYRTSCGNPVRLAQSPVATTSATAVARLLDAGAEFIGKAQTDELAWSIIGRNPHFGPTINPAAPAEIALGSDTGGSVRAPASFCGTWGLRPSWGRVPLDGCMPLVPSFDTPGLFACDGATLALAASAMLGPDTAELSDAVPRAATDMLDNCTADARAALAPIASEMTQGETALFAASPQVLHDCFDVLQSREVVASQGPWIEATNPPLGELVRPRYDAALTFSAAQEDAARADRLRLTDAIKARMEGAAVVAPVVHDIAIHADAGAAAHLAFGPKARCLLAVAGIAGLPQVVFPAATVEGAPLGLSLIGPQGTDLALIAMAVNLFDEHLQKGLK